MDSPQEFALQTGHFVVDVSKASSLNSYVVGTQVLLEGHMRVTFNTNTKIQLFEFYAKSFTEFIPKSALLPSVQPAEKNTSGTATPRRRSSAATIPTTPVNEFGTPIRAMRCLEVGTFCCARSWRLTPFLDRRSCEQHARPDRVYNAYGAQSTCWSSRLRREIERNTGEVGDSCAAVTGALHHSCYNAINRLYVY